MPVLSNDGTQRGSGAFVDREQKRIKGEMPEKGGTV